MPEEVQEECKGGDCPLRPQFETGGSDEVENGNRKVRLTTSKYVQLLIDARETDPNCWPPGLEKAASMIERARAIEDECVEKWGEFDPDKLKAKQSREYFEIQLALDSLQEEADGHALDLEHAIGEARQTIEASDTQEAEENDGEPPLAPAPTRQPNVSATSFDLPASNGPPAGGFFAAPIPSTEDEGLALSLSRVDSSADEDEPPLMLTPQSWLEMPPLQRPDNYA